MEYPNIIITLCLGVFIMAAYAVETLPFLPPRLRPYLNFVNACGAVAWAWSAMWIGQTNPAGGIIALLTATVAFLKIISFSLVCRELRLETAGKDKTYRPTLSQLWYFIFAPTMVLPASVHISVLCLALVEGCGLCRFSSLLIRGRPRCGGGGVARRSAELLGVWAGILVVAVQYVVPGLMNTIVPLEKGNLYLIVEGLCKLAVPNFIIWIMGFYAIFHLQLNLIAEITR